MQAEQPLLMRQIRAKRLLQSMVLNRALHFFANVFPNMPVFPPLPAWIANEQGGLSSIECLESLNSEGRQCSSMCSRLEGWDPKGQIHCLETRHEPLARIFCTRGSSWPDKHKSETLPVRTFKPLSTIWFWAYPNGANPTELQKTGG